MLLPPSSPTRAAGCADAAKYSGPAPTVLAPGASQTLNIDSKWVGRIFASHPACGPKGESCTITEYNLGARSFSAFDISTKFVAAPDSGSQFTPQTYDISNIQRVHGTPSKSPLQGATTVTCTNANCGVVHSAYPLGTTTGCGNDSPVRACGAGTVAFTVTFWPLKKSKCRMFVVMSIKTGAWSTHWWNAVAVVLLRST
ncbi:hypothetical protein B0H14DRAFT_3174535 [Mycena olivaceomarginata]|nr:hypothetical protein B0H14DRAFT_3174535 [Mycena olivaceomarginata]